MRRRLGTTVAPNQYIVVFKDSVKDVQAKVDELRLTTAPCGRVAFVYEIAMKGFALHDCLDAADLTELLDDDAVLYAIADEVATGDTVQSVAGQYWLDRLDQRALPLDQQYEYNDPGMDDSSNNVTIYVFDSGIRTTHVEFADGRAVCGFNALINAGEPSCADNEGHGTFTAACAAGKTYGVAKNASIVAVRVLDRTANGPISGIIAGLEYVANEKKKNPDKPMVVSMSL